MNDLFYYYFAGGLAFVGGARTLSYAIDMKKKINVKLFIVFLVCSILFVCLGLFTIIFEKMDCLCAILYAIFSLYTTYRGSYKPTIGFTSDYVNYVEEYIIDIIVLIFGFVKMFM